MRFTTVHINALCALFIMLILACGLIAVLIFGNGILSEQDRMMTLAAIGGVIYGVRAVAMTFAGTIANCPHCGGSINTEGDK